MLLLSFLIATSLIVIAQNTDTPSYEDLVRRIEQLEKAQQESNDAEPREKFNKNNRLLLGGYGEAVYSRHFYSSNWKRYTDASLYKDDDGFGRIDIPHFVLMMQYDFGHGWKFGTEIEFEHGGLESAMEIEEEETGEYESEIEKGGEVALEQMWLEKTISPAFHIKAGHFVVPVGGTNARHLPTEFFTNARPEGDATVFPQTWHQTGLSLWGKKGSWRYEGQLIAALDGYMFDDNYWAHNASVSPFEFKIANNLAGVARIDNYSIAGLQMGVSVYAGKAGHNSLKQDNYSDIDALVTIGAFDFQYQSPDTKNLVARGGIIYGNIEDSEALTAANMSNRSDSPSPKDKVAKNAISANIELGYNLFARSSHSKLQNQKLYIFGRFDFYDTMFKTEGSIYDDERFGRKCYVAGINYYPVKSIVIKADYSYRDFTSAYNDEPTLSLGIAFSGLFVH